MINAHFNPNDLIRELNAGNTDGVISEDQQKSFKYRAQKHMRDFNSFVMNSTYNFYREGVLGNYYRKIGDSTK